MTIKNCLAFLVILSFVKYLASGLIPSEWPNKYMPMVWIDGRSREGPVEINTFFDRIIVIYLLDPVLENDQLVGEPTCNKATGVFITTQLILTSFNAFRNLTRTDMLSKMRVLHMHGRDVKNDTRITDSYFFTNSVNSAQKDYGYEIVCGRQVIPSDPSQWPIDFQHGPNIPAHDLMVIRLKKPVEFVNPIPPLLEDFIDVASWPMRPKGGAHRKSLFSPIKTILAKLGDKMYIDETKFASLGHLSDEHIRLQSYLEKGEFGNFEDCEEWMPREWGNFICLGNSENYPGLAAGAMLYSGEQLFGVGAFMLKKGKNSVLVFTDVRPYWDLLHRTCTEEDTNLANKKL